MMRVQMDHFIRDCVEGQRDWPRSDQRRFFPKEKSKPVAKPRGYEPISLAEIDDRRIRLGISQAQLCRAAGVSESTLTRVRQENREPTRRIRTCLMHALNAFIAERRVTLS